MKLAVALPLVLSTVSFVLAMLALFAGSSKGFMEDYHIMVFNTSSLGHNVISSLAAGDSASSTTTSAPATATSSRGGGLGGLLSSIEASATAIAGSIQSEAASILNDIGNDIADELADELGIDQFYSLHIMDLCEGNYAPNATSPSARANVSSCTPRMNFSAMDLSGILDQQLSVGPFNLSLADLGITDSIQDKLDDLPTLFEAMAAIYIISAAFCGLSVLGSLAGLLLLPRSSGRKIPLANLAVALLAMLFLLAGSLVYTVGGSMVVDKIHNLGADDLGLRASVGAKFMGVSWAAFALMTLATAYWVYDLFSQTKARGRAARTRGKQEKPSLESSRSGRGRFSKS